LFAENEASGKQNSVLDLAPYFPKFVWLLRDFNLKLVDNNNDPITPKQYLDFALGLFSEKTKMEYKEHKIQDHRNQLKP
jgi:hypothetical protein